MYQGQIIDTHMHIWDVKNGLEWLPLLADGVLNHNFGMKEYLEMSKNQPISQMVFIECGAFPHNPVLETKWVQEQADRFGGPQAIIAFAKLGSAEFEKVLKGHLQYSAVRGIRMPLNHVGGCFGAERDDYMRDPIWRKDFALLTKYKLHFEMQIFDRQIPDAVALAKAFPDTLIVLQHLGWPDHFDFELWSERMAEIALQPNVVLKLSCIGWIFQKEEELMIKRYLEKAVELFGVERCMVGSNCPPDSIFISFDDIFRIMREALLSYSALDQQKLFYGNAKRIYRI